MTVRTKAGLATQVATLLADNSTGAISESDLREVSTDLIDSLVASDDVSTIVQLTQAAYDALSPPVAGVLYVVVG